MVYCNANNKTSPARFDKELGKQQALELRMSRTPDGRIWTYDMIGQELGVSPMAIWRWIAEAMTEIKYDNRERAHELRAINTHRLELAIGKIIAKIESTQADDRDYNVLVKLIQTENKMWGVNEPDALELTVKIENMTTEEKIKRISELMEQAYHARLSSGQETPPDPHWRVVDDDKVATPTIVDIPTIVDTEVVDA